jgi:hypothetical protein
MRTVLGLEPDRNGYKDASFTYLVNRSTSPVLHHLPPGTRIFMQRQSALPYLRFKGASVAADMAPWSRTSPSEAKAGAIVYQERAPTTGAMYSRLVALGYPEQSWMRMDGATFQSIHKDILQWLMRMPSVSIQAWPSPYQSAVSLYRSSSLPAEVSQWLSGKHLQAQSFVPWHSGNSAEPTTLFHPVQRRTVPPTALLVPENNQDLARETLFFTIISGDFEDNSVPEFLARTADANNDVVAVPARLWSPTAGHGTPTLAAWRHEFDLTHKTGGLCLVDISALGATGASGLDLLTSRSREAKGSIWLASPDTIARWWSQRKSVDARLSRNGDAYTLELQNRGEHALDHPIRLYLTLGSATTHITLHVPPPCKPQT